MKTLAAILCFMCATAHAASWADQYTATKQKNREYWKERCELNGIIMLKPNGDTFVRTITKCDGKERFDDISFYWPRGGPHTPDHLCKLDKVEKLDKWAFHLFHTCKYVVAPETRGPFLVQFDGENILITNSENF